MAAIVRGTKSAGGTNFSANVLIKSAEVNTDFNNLYTDYNGNIGNTNVSAAAAIETTKIDGYSDSATERTTETTPGVTGTESDATTLAGELERLRYKIKQIGLGTSVKRLDGTAAVDLVSWIDTPQTGPNLIRNGNFSVKTTIPTDAPDGWALVGTPGTLDLTTTGVTEGHTSGRAIRIAALGAGSEGISQTLAGLKASTKYLIGCRGKVNNAGDILRLATTGADSTAPGTFDELALDTTSTSYVTLSGVIVTDSTPTDIVVQLLAVADGDSVDVTHVWVRECATDPIPQSNSAWAYHELTADTPLHYVAGGYVDSGLTVNVVCPGPGYVIEVEAKCDVQNDTGSNEGDVGIWSLRENGTEVDCLYMPPLLAAAGQDKATIRFSYVKTAPVAGTTYTYTVFARTANRSLDRNGAAISAETPRSWIRCRAVLESGGW